MGLYMDRRRKYIDHWFVFAFSPFSLSLAKGCPPLPPPPSGRLVSSIGGAVQRVECNPGYYLSSSPMLFCDKYDWNGTVPLCRGIIITDVAHIVPFFKLKKKYMCNFFFFKGNGILPSMSCNMESEDLCGWIQDSSDDFDWTLNNYGTPSSHLGTGPSFDHTLGAGKGGKIKIFYSSYFESGCLLLWIVSFSLILSLFAPAAGPFKSWWARPSSRKWSCKCVRKSLSLSLSLLSYGNEVGLQGCALTPQGRRE